MKIRYDMVSCYVTRPTEDGASNEYLQLRRSRNDFMGGTWQTIAGTSQANETPVETVLRELREESGLLPVELYRLDHVSVFYIAATNTLWHCIPFCAIVSRRHAVVLNEEHDALRWIAVDEVEEYFMWQENLQAIQLIQNQIIKSGLAKPHLRIPLPPM